MFNGFNVCCQALIYSQGSQSDRSLRNVLFDKGHKSATTFRIEMHVNIGTAEGLTKFYYPHYGCAFCSISKKYFELTDHHCKKGKPIGRYINSVTLHNKQADCQLFAYFEQQRLLCQTEAIENMLAFSKSS